MYVHVHAHTMNLTASVANTTRWSRDPHCMEFQISHVCGHTMHNIIQDLTFVCKHCEPSTIHTWNEYIHTLATDASIVTHTYVHHHTRWSTLLAPPLKTRVRSRLTKSGGCITNNNTNRCKHNSRPDNSTPKSNWNATSVYHWTPIPATTRLCRIQENPQRAKLPKRDIQ